MDAGPAPSELVTLLGANPPSSGWADRHSVAMSNWERTLVTKAYQAALDANRSYMGMHSGYLDPAAAMQFQARTIGGGYPQDAHR